MKNVAVPIDGSPVVLTDGMTLEDTRVVVQLPVYGRVIFTENCGIHVVGSHVTVRDCCIEVI